MAVNNVKRELQTEGLTLAEASIVSGIGRTKLYQAIADGQLTARKYGSRTIVLRSELLRFLTSLPEVQ
jgi:excisionase family DNA binding protein